MNSKETRQKMSDSQKEKMKLPENRKKIGDALKRKGISPRYVVPREKIPRGENHWNWKGGGVVNGSKKQIRQARIKQNGGSHTLKEWETLKAQYNWTCPICKKSEPEIKLTKDHSIPLSKGGSNNIENIQPFCRRCNSVKGTKIIN